MLLYCRHLGIPPRGGTLIGDAKRHPRPWVWILVVLRHRLADGLLRRREEATGDHGSHNRPQDRRDPRTAGVARAPSHRPASCPSPRTSNMEEWSSFAA